MIIITSFFQNGIQGRKSSSVSNSLYPGQRFRFQANYYLAKISVSYSARSRIANPGCQHKIIPLIISYGSFAIITL